MNILDDNDKHLLRKLSNYLRASGMKYASIEMEAEGGRLDIDNYPNFSNNWTVEIPEWIVPTLQKIVDYSEPHIEYPENYSYNNFEINIDAIEKTIESTQNWGWYEASDDSVTEWAEGDDETLEGVFDSLESLEDAEDTYTLKYEGLGDSGYIEGSFDDGTMTPREVENWAYEQLESLHGGWEINEGSQGEFEFNLKNKTVVLRHQFNEENQDSETIFSENFGQKQ